MNLYRVTWVETWGEVASGVVESNDITTALNGSFSPPGSGRHISVNGGIVNGQPILKIEVLLETEAERS